MKMFKSELGKIKARYKVAWWCGLGLLVAMFVAPYLVQMPERRRAAEFAEAFGDKILGGTMGEVINLVGRPDETDRRQTTMMYYYEREFQRQPTKKKVRLLVVFLDGHAARVTHSILK